MTEAHFEAKAFVGNYARIHDLVTFCGIAVAHCAFLIFKLRRLVVLVLCFGVPIFLFVLCIATHNNAQSIENERALFHFLFALLHFSVLISQFSLVQAVFYVCSGATFKVIFVAIVLYIVRYAFENVYFSSFTPCFVYELQAITVAPMQEERVFIVEQLFSLMAMIYGRQWWKILVLTLFAVYLPNMTRYVKANYQAMHMMAMSLNFLMSLQQFGWAISATVAICIAAVGMLRYLRAQDMRRTRFVHRELLYRTITTKLLFEQRCVVAEEFFYYFEHCKTKPIFAFTKRRVWDSRYGDKELIALLKPSMSIPLYLCRCFALPKRKGSVLQLAWQSVNGITDIIAIAKQDPELHILYEKHLLGVDSLYEWLLLKKWFFNLQTAREFVIGELEDAMHQRETHCAATLDTNQFFIKPLSSYSTNQTIVYLLVNCEERAHYYSLARYVAQINDLYGYTLVFLLTNEKTSIEVLCDTILESTFPCLNWRKEGLQAISKETTIVRKIVDFLLPTPTIVAETRSDVYEFPASDYTCYFPQHFYKLEQAIKLERTLASECEEDSFNWHFNEFRDEYKKCIGELAVLQKLHHTGITFAIRPEMQAWRVLHNCSAIEQQPAGSQEPRLLPAVEEDKLQEWNVIGENSSILNVYGEILLGDMVRMAEKVHESTAISDDQQYPQIFKMFDEFACRVSVYLAFHLNEPQHSNSIFVLISLQAAFSRLMRHLRITQKSGDEVYRHITHGMLNAFDPHYIATHRQQDNKITCAKFSFSNHDSKSAEECNQHLSINEFLYEDEIGRSMNTEKLRRSKQFDDSRQKSNFRCLTFTSELIALIGSVLLFQFWIWKTNASQMQYTEYFVDFSRSYDGSMQLLQNELLFSPSNIQALKSNQSEILSKQDFDYHDAWITDIMAYNEETVENYVDLEFSYLHMENELVISGLTKYEEEDQLRPSYANSLDSRYNLEQLANQQLFSFHKSNYSQISGYFAWADVSSIVFLAVYMLCDSVVVRYFCKLIKTELGKSFPVEFANRLLAKLHDLYEKHFKCVKEIATLEVGEHVVLQASQKCHAKAKISFYDVFPVFLVFCRNQKFDDVKARWAENRVYEGTIATILHFVFFALCAVLAATLCTSELNRVSEFEEEIELQFQSAKEHAILEQQLKKLIFQAHKLLYCDDCRMQIQDINTDFSTRFEALAFVELLAGCAAFADANGTEEREEGDFRSGVTSQAVQLQFLRHLSSLQREMQIAWSLHEMRFESLENTTGMFNYSRNSTIDERILSNATFDVCAELRANSYDIDRKALSEAEQLEFARCITKSELYRRNVIDIMEYLQSSLDIQSPRHIFERLSRKTYLILCCVIILVVVTLACAGQLYKFVAANTLFEYELFPRCIACLTLIFAATLIWAELCLFASTRIMHNQLRIFIAVGKSLYNDNYSFYNWLIDVNYTSSNPFEYVQVDFTAEMKNLLNGAQELENLHGKQLFSEALIMEAWRTKFNIVALYKQTEDRLAADDAGNKSFVPFNVAFEFYDLLVEETSALQRHMNTMFSNLAIGRFVQVEEWILIAVIAIFYAWQLTCEPVAALTASNGGGCPPRLFDHELNRLGTKIMDGSVSMENIARDFFALNNTRILRRKVFVSLFPFIFLVVYLTVIKIVIAAQPIEPFIHQERSVIVQSLQMRLSYEIQRLAALESNKGFLVVEAPTFNAQRTIESIAAELAQLLASDAYGTSAMMRYGEIEEVALNETFSPLIFRTLWTETAYESNLEPSAAEIPMLYTSFAKPREISNETKQAISILQQAAENPERIYEALECINKQESAFEAPTIRIFYTINTAALVFVCLLLVWKYFSGILTYLGQLDAMATMFKKARLDNPF